MQVASLLAQVTRDDLVRLEALAAAGRRDEAPPLVHRMLGGFRIFAHVPAFVHIRDVVDAMQASNVDALFEKLPEYRARLLDFVDRLERAARQASGR